MKISIVTVVYNSFQFIETSLKSVQFQEFSDFEHVIVDGGSKDGTCEIIKKNLSENQKFISEPDDGIYDAMNKGLKLATGEIVGFLNADDVFADNDVLSKVAEIFTKLDVDSVYGDLVYTDKDLRRKIRYWKSGQYIKGSMENGWMPPHPTFFVKKVVYDRLGYFDLSYNISADYELMLRFLHKNGISTHYIPEVLVKMRTGGKSYRIGNYLAKFKEDYRAMTNNHISNPLLCLTRKNIGKLPQFLTV